MSDEFTKAENLLNKIADRIPDGHSHSLGIGQFLESVLATLDAQSAQIQDLLDSQHTCFCDMNEDELY